MKKINYILSIASSIASLIAVLGDNMVDANYFLLLTILFHLYAKDYE